MDRISAAAGRNPTFLLAVALAFRVGERWALRAGYRALALDREEGDIGLDIVIHGPILGVVWRFRP
jgi:hypothetical protein